MEEMNKDDNVTIERVIAEAELIRNREEKVGLESELEAAKQELENLKNIEKEHAEANQTQEEQAPHSEEK